MSEEETKTGADLRAGDDAARKEAARLMGAARTERKRASSAANGVRGGRPKNLNGGRPLGPLSETACTCGAGDATLTTEGRPAHPTTCPRGRVIRYRMQKGLPLT